MLLRTSRNAGLATSIALGLALGTFPATAQVPAAPADLPAAVPAPGNPRDPATMPERSATAEILEGSVKKVDPGAGTLEMSDSAPGATNRTLAIVAETLIAVDGRPGTLADLQEGTKVKAAYVPRDGKDVVILIEVVPAQ
jgi:ABC-type transport system substrate-binding protein